MTNLDYIKTLTAEELASYIYYVIIKIGQCYTQSQKGVAEWLKKERKTKEYLEEEWEQIRRGEQDEAD